MESAAGGPPPQRQTNVIPIGVKLDRRFKCPWVSLYVIAASCIV